MEHVPVLEKEEDYGLIRPSLIKQLKSILDQYPDNGQILKELLQNAEDAGAKHVKFVYDKHSYGHSHLHHPDLATFQGPALYAYNDALFSEQDWTGIRMLQDSIKETDSMKIGRFGLGFKSVFHMTDLPSVLSGERLFFIDPHERYFLYQGDRTSGYMWNLAERSAELRRIPHQFAPFSDGICGSNTDTLRAGYYPGTLFRFPLRQTPSELSSTAYGPDRIEALLNQFMSDARLLLVFLKNVENLEICVRDEGSSRAVPIFGVKLAQCCHSEVLESRRCIVDAIQSRSTEAVSMTYLLAIETERFEKGKTTEKKVYRYLVNEYYSGGRTSRALAELRNDPSLSLVPLVGTAIDLDGIPQSGIRSETASKTEKTKENSDAAEESDVAPGGQVFCFLPLAMQEKSSTGFPVHVNGYFAVSQNRQHLKWPSVGQKVDSDKSLKWNYCLITELIPKSYRDLIIAGTQMKDLTPENIYAAMPNIISVDEKWQIAMEPFYTSLFELPVFYACQKHGVAKWVRVSDCVFDCLRREDTETRSLIVSTLINAGVMIATDVSDHLLLALGAFGRCSPELVSPGLVRLTLSGCPASYVQLSRPSKLMLLRYVLKDEDFRDMAGLELLPLADRNFTKFILVSKGRAAVDPVFFPTTEFPASLLPTLGKILIDIDDLDDLLKHKLGKMAQEGCTQIGYLTKDAVTKLLPKVIPVAWCQQSLISWEPSSSSLLTPEWLSLVWVFLRTHYPSNLMPFMNLPILPLTPSVPIKLVPLTLNGCVILRSGIGTSLSVGVVKVLELLGAFIADELPQYVRDHAAVIGNYVRLPIAEDVVDVMHNAFQLHGGQKAVDGIRTLTSDTEKADVRELIAQLHASALEPSHIRFLRQLPIFKCSSGCEEASQHSYCSIDQVGRAAPVHQLSIGSRTKYLDVGGDENATKAAALLGAKFINVTTALSDLLTTEFRMNLPDAKTADSLASSVFTNFSAYCAEDPNISATLSKVRFVKVCGNEGYAAPSALFDPEVKELHLLLAGANVFPAEECALPKNLQHLRRMGLKTVADLTANDLLSSMIRIEKMATSSETLNAARASSKAIIDFLGKSPDLLWHEVNGRILLKWATSLCWVAAVQEKPSMFPASLDWVGADNALHVSAAVISAEWAPVVGSIQPVVSCSQAVACAFGWDIQPEISLVVHQLAVVVDRYNSSEKAQYLSLVMSIYNVLSRVDTKQLLAVLNKCSLSCWIWQGDGFASIAQVVLKRPPVDLRPYVYLVPSEMQSFAAFLQKCGVRERCSTDVFVSVLHKIRRKYSGSQFELDDVDADTQLTINILNELARSADLKAGTLANLLVLCQSSDQVLSPLMLLPVAECTYCDVDWLRRGFDVTEFDTQDGISFIHPQLPTPTAAALGVPTLMSRMLHAEELAMTSFGQSEPLTDRLRKLLEDYSDGLAIPKEMIQNADDAGASEVRFLYDERTNEDAMKYLIDEGMRSCQGPALWAYNDAVFTDHDFESIIRLGGAMKEQEPEKIGKFGLGFNAVYNVTDVPSFVTRNVLVIFDPHTTHLGRGIKDRSRPGIRINLDKNRMLVRRLPDQFRPYEDVFGCRLNTIEGETVYFNGTLFRLPLRSREQAAHSEISSVHYDHAQVAALFQLMAQNAHHLLTFTQNVQRISVYHIPADGCAARPSLLLQINKGLVKVIRELNAPGDWRKRLTDGAVKSEDEAALSRNCGVLFAAAAYMKQLESASGKKKIPEPPCSSLLIGMSVSISDSGASLGLKSAEGSESYWLVSSCIGTKRSLELARQMRGGFAPAAGVACRLQPTGNGGYVPSTLGCGTHSRSRAYCYLPLPVLTGLPVHVNGVFALHSNRRHLSHITEDEKTNAHVEWNRVLLQDAVTDAYVQMLTDIESVLLTSDADHANVTLYNLWPVADSVDPYFACLVESFYNRVVKSNDVPLLYDSGKAVAFEQVVFLEQSLADVKSVGSFALEILGTSFGGKTVSILSDSVSKSFTLFGLHDAISSKMYCLNRFFAEIFFPNISQLTANVRDALLLHAISLCNVSLEAIMKDSACIPASPDGTKLCKPRELVHPTCKAALLYSPEDGRFPHGPAFQDVGVLQCLERLGLTVGDISWDDLLERSTCLHLIWSQNPQLGKSRQRAILLFLDHLLVRAPKSDVNNAAWLGALSNVPFLSVMPKASNFPLHWAGEQHADQLMCASDLFTENMRYLVSATCCIVDETAMTSRVRDYLGISNNCPTVEHVVTQFEHVLMVDLSKLNVKQYDELQNCVRAIYGYLQDQCSNDENVANAIREAFADRPCILLDRAFVSAKQTAVDFPFNCAPFLYGLPTDFATRFRSIMLLLGVRTQFGVGDYMSVLNELNGEAGEQILNERMLDVATRMVTQLNNTMKVSGLSAADVEQQCGPILVPNAASRLCPASSLCYNDCPWLTDAGLVSFAHPSITYPTSACLGVRTKRQEALRRYARGIPFGQKERLTNSLHRLLDSYPFDHEILKELVQNADDAGATEIHFVADWRNHPDTRVFETSWRPLQGPALCVYNNRPFSDSDLEGIQRFGEGSKACDPSATGQYGVGFSSVYHLTDAPSLLTTRPDGDQMLCVFDPLCSYVPGATEAEPGMRYDDIEALRAAFPDVFSCYMEQHFPGNGTIFRFPFRTQAMAEVSSISKAVVKPPRVRSILNQLKEEVFEILLFTNHLEQISISEVDPATGCLSSTYTVKILADNESKQARYKLAAAKKKMAEALKTDPCLALRSTPPCSVSLTLLITDNFGCQEKWVVAHQLGFGEDVKLPFDVENAFSAGELALLPHGAAACLIERRQHNQIDSACRPGRAFCFLPLPIETELPVHINGHFALGYENRRHLWTNADRAGYKRQWNDLLCSSAIAPAYVTLLVALRMRSLNYVHVEDDVMQVTCSRPMLNSTLQAYMAFFPKFSETKPQWSVLTTAVYQAIEHTGAPLLASVCEIEVANRKPVTPPVSPANVAIVWQIMWLPPVGQGIFFRRSEPDAASEVQTQSSSSLIGKVKGWFGLSTTPVSQERRTEDVLAEVLLGCGLKLVESSPELFENFRRAGVEVDYMTPESVLTFFESYGEEDSPCNLGTLPRKIEDTPFQNEKTLLLVLKYVKSAENFSERIDGLPLLLKADNTLDCFSSSSPVYTSEFHDVMHGSEQLFVKPSVGKLLDIGQSTAENKSIVREFGLNDLAEHLPNVLPVEKFCNDDGFMEWKKTGASALPNEYWLRRLWTFIDGYIDRSVGSDSEFYNKQELMKLVKAEMEPLSNWCILPVRVGSKYYLYSPEAAAEKVVDVRSSNAQNFGISVIIQRLGFPELDFQSMHPEVSSEKDLIRTIPVNLEKPYEMLCLLQQRFSDVSAETKVLTKDNCNLLLTYLAASVEVLMAYDDAAEKVRDLPIFTTICGDIIRLTGCLVYTLPAKIPTNGIDVWQSRSGTVFLARSDALQPLYDFMACASVGMLDVYCQFIFQHFEYFPYGDRLIHLHHVYTQYLQNNSSIISPDERESLLESLRSLAFIEDEEGEVQRADYFYDPENVVFRVMQPAGRFAPRAEQLFKESEWYSFLALLGMVRNVTPEKFMEFLRTVEHEGHDVQSASALTKSKVLVQHLFANPELLYDSALDDIADIAFVVPETAAPSLRSICPQYGDIGNDRLGFVHFRNAVSKEYEKVCWTSASLLPSWADPQQFNLAPDKKDWIIDRLHIQKSPSVDTVLRHLENLCGSNSLLVAPQTIKMDVFRAIYRFFDNADVAGEAKEKLERIKCVLVDDGRSLVMPRQTVLNMYDTDEIRPYLYRLPLDLGEHRHLFAKLGTTDRATVAQYAEVLSRLHEDSGKSRLLPNELLAAYRAVRGLLESLEATPASARDVSVPCLYMPNADGRLVDAERLVFNDSPAFYDRVRDFNLHFVVDLQECGVQLRSIEETLCALPSRLRPAMLSAVVQETLVDECRKSVSKTRGVAGFLGARLKSEQFQQAVIRLARHEAFKSGRGVDEVAMFGVLDRLSTISVYTAPQLMTHLIMKGKPISGSQMVKSCFVERIGSGVSGVNQWNIYIKDDADAVGPSAALLSQDLLISLAEVINGILQGMLRDTVLYLLPALSCPDPDGISSRMDHLNIRVDHSLKSAATLSGHSGRAAALPAVGSTVEEGVKKFCVGMKDNQKICFQPGEYIACCERQGDEKLVYGKVVEELQSPDDIQIYLVDLGNGQDGVIASAANMLKFVRK